MFTILIKLTQTSPLIYFLIAVSFSSVSKGQTLQSQRYETIIQDGERELYEVVSAHEKGIILYRRLTQQRENIIEVIRVDTTLTEVWRGSIQLNLDEVILFTYVKQAFLYLLIKSRNYSMGDFLLVELTLETGSYNLFTAKNLIPFSATEFIVTNRVALIGGYFNYRPLILHFNFRTLQSKILPGFFNEPGELTQLKPNRDGSIDVIVSAKNYNKQKSLWIRNYDSLGSLIKTTILQPEEKKNLLYARSLKNENGEQIVSGVYGRYTDYSRGIFVASINVFGEYAIKYYAFSELQHFFNYMKARREKRVKEKIERRKIKGKKIKFNYRILVEELIPYGNQYILLGEAFYPHYTYARNFAPYSFNYRTQAYHIPTSRSDLIFDGYQYTHAVVIGFDKNGKLLWDNSFEINDVKTYELEQFVKIIPQDKNIALLYLYENEIRSKIISGSEMQEGKSIDVVKMKFSDDQVKNKETETSKLDYWYGRNFFAYGVQKVHNLREPSVPAERKVFFVNKISFRK
ncbi:MAG: hypothetical protein JJE09_09435 [Bacteroidia bacterium]|nr:hypothetical protein [Bacteroidia bacterium]